MSFKELIDAYQGMIEDKQEVGKKLFEKIEERKIIVDNHPGCCVLWSDVEKIFDELKAEVVKIPQDVADWIGFYKGRGCTLQESTDSSVYYDVSVLDEFEDKHSNVSVPNALSWIFKNLKTYARAWIEGYEVEEEKRYLVKLKATNQYLHVDNFSKASFLPLSISSFGTEVTKTMLDNLGLSEVFNNPLFKVEEVK
jgi:hypothetical protein